MKRWVSNTAGSRHGCPFLLYESPFTDISPLGPESLFPSAEIDNLVAAIDEVNARAAAG